MRKARGIKLIAVFLVAAVVNVVFGFCVLAKAQILKKPAENSYVFDYANLIDSSDEEEMRALAKEIEDKSKAEIVVVTVETLGSYTIEEYANELFRSWEIGDKELNNGVLILVNKENLLLGKKGRIRIEVGYGLEGAITDGKAGRILDEYAIPAFERNEYSKGIRDTFLAVASEVANEYGLKIDGLSGYGASEDVNENEVTSDGNAENVVDVPFGLGIGAGLIVGFGLFFFIIFLMVIVILYNQPYAGKKYEWTWKNGKWEKKVYVYRYDDLWKNNRSFFDDSDDSDSFGSGGGFGGFGGGSSGGGGASR
ncbi:TPM domain-containing protein [Caldicellulosiruptor changbaiensis]|uniref:TPM domain-containing protein n=1 Tax=Caldicellulosiruptor changbaiensis TaxID=1222016 RepID=A0A3T0D9F9_9FIRM|nr:TPM domain-containing protein [Caldicellulosiruptor changbaiensis]AZT91559.1 TPM domain-containing protein [Caldicellulosiruptor changbaiensis]